MIVDWLVFPLLLLAVCLGCGLTVERLTGWQLWGGLLPAVGLVLVIVVSSLTTNYAGTAPLTTPVVLVLAVAGYASSRKRLASFRLEPWALVVALALFAVYAAPIVLFGTAGFAGYFVDNDAAFHFALIDQLMAHGHDIAGLPTSVYSYILNEYLSSSYPIGADVAVGAIRPLIGQDIAWIYQPYLAMILTFGGVVLYELLRDSVRSTALRAAIAFIAAQAGLVYAFYLETSIKELATTMIISLMVVLVFATLRQPLRVRTLLPLALATVAAFDVLNFAAIPWIGIPLAAFVVVAAWRMRGTLRSLSRRSLAASVCLGVVALGVLLFPILERASTFVGVASSVLTGSAGLGNLAGPLPKWELVGIWPSADFRFSVATQYQLAYVLIGVAIVSSLLGIAWMIRRRRLAPLLLVAGNGIATIFLLSQGNAYASAKVMMIFSLTAVLAAMLGPAALNEGARRFEGWALAAAIAGGVLWTNVLAFENVSVAPRARFDELAEIGARFSGQGPALYNLSDEFALHFLRTEAPSDPADGPLQPRAGLPPRTAAQARLSWDPNDLDFGYLQSFGLLVLGRSPVSSRPPADFKVVFQGRYYTVWKHVSSPKVLAHMPVSSGLDATPPRCAAVRALAAAASRQRAVIAYVQRDATPTLLPTHAARPPDWGLVAGDDDDLIPREQTGILTGLVKVTRPGRYQVWLGGSFSQHYSVWIGRRMVGATPLDVGPPGQYVRIGQIMLPAGSAPVLIVRPANRSTAGEDATTQLLGPLVLTRTDAPPPVEEISPNKARSLCGRPLEWVEIVRPATGSQLASRP
jgi:hypothetical protein